MRNTHKPPASTAPVRGHALLADLLVMAFTGASIAVFAWRALGLPASGNAHPEWLFPFTLFAIGVGTCLLQLVHRLLARKYPVQAAARRKHILPPQHRPAPTNGKPGQQHGHTGAKAERVRFSGRS